MAAQDRQFAVALAADQQVCAGRGEGGDQGCGVVARSASSSIPGRRLRVRCRAWSSSPVLTGPDTASRTWRVPAGQQCAEPQLRVDGTAVVAALSGVADGVGRCVRDGQDRSVDHGQQQATPPYVGGDGSGRATQQIEQDPHGLRAEAGPGLPQRAAAGRGDGQTRHAAQPAGQPAPHLPVVSTVCPGWIPGPSPVSAFHAVTAAHGSVAASA